MTIVANVLALLLFGLPLLQILTVPAAAARRGYSAGAWFALTLLWLVVWAPLVLIAWWFGVVAALLAPAVAGILSGDATTVLVTGAIAFLGMVVLFAISFGPHCMLHAFTRAPRRRPRRRRTRRRIR